MPVFLMVWLSFSCQDCFADTISDSAQKMHVAMDCCPPGAHHAQDDAVDMSGCDNNYLMNLPTITDQAAAQLADFQIVMLPVATIRFEANYPNLIVPVARQHEPAPFSDRLFSSYRILLI